MERVYWCRFENQRGQTWETRNPADRSAKLEIHRIRRVTQVEQREKTERASVRSAEWEEEAFRRLMQELQSFRHAQAMEALSKVR